MIPNDPILQVLESTPVKVPDKRAETNYPCSIPSELSGLQNTWALKKAILGHEVWGGFAIQQQISKRVPKSWDFVQENDSSSKIKDQPGIRKEHLLTSTQKYQENPEE